MELNCDFFGGTYIKIEWSAKEPEHKKTNATRLYIKNLRITVTQEDLADHFKGYGKIQSIMVRLYYNKKLFPDSKGAVWS